MKKLLLILIASLSLLVSPSVGHEAVRTELTNKVQTTVYVTKTGKKYHTSFCRYLSKSKIETTKKAAISSGFTACSICKP